MILDDGGDATLRHPPGSNERRTGSSTRPQLRRSDLMRPLARSSGRPPSAARGKEIAGHEETTTGVTA
jgi:S-adenosylhomocysteine hydrolase